MFSLLNTEALVYVFLDELLASSFHISEASPLTPQVAVKMIYEASALDIAACMPLA